MALAQAAAQEQLRRAEQAVHATRELARNCKATNQRDDGLSIAQDAEDIIMQIQEKVGCRHL